MEKYKNKNGIELSYTNDNDVHQVLVKEVIGEAIKILGMYDRNCKISMGMAMSNTKRFLKTNFDIDTKWDSKRVIGGVVVKVRLDTKLGERMYLNSIKGKSV